MANKTLTIALVFASTCALSALYFGRRMLCRSLEVKMVSEKEFTEIMKLIARAIFSRLFEAAQVAQRVPAEDSEQHMSALLSSVHQELGIAQSVILKQIGLTEADLQAAQSRYYKTGLVDVDAVIESIPRMFESYRRGEFPVLPDCVFQQTPTLDDEELLTVIRSAMIAKTQAALNHDSVPSEIEEEVILTSGFTDPVALYNEAAKRITGQGFKTQLMQIVLECHNLVKAHLED